MTYIKTLTLLIIALITLMGCTNDYFTSYDGIAINAEIFDDFYYPEPLIGVHFTNETIKDGLNSVYFNTSGELVGEGGEWFLTAERDEYEEYYYEEMMRIIGLG